MPLEIFLFFQQILLFSLLTFFVFLHTDGHRGFGFVQYFLEEDAAAAMDNMDGAEIEGRVLRVNIAKPIKHKLGATKAGWCLASFPVVFTSSHSGFVTNILINFIFW